MGDRAFRLTIASLLTGVLLSLTGCGSSTPTAPRSDLSDEHKKQLKDLDEQRVDEWGKKKPKK